MEARLTDGRMPGKNEFVDQFQEPELLSESNYESEQSPEFDAYRASRNSTEARQGSVSAETDSDIIFSNWHVPCHDVIMRDTNGMCQILHVQPNRPGVSLLTYEQKAAMKEFGRRGSESIVVKGNRSWFGIPDQEELQESGVQSRKLLSVDTADRWRLLFDPQANEIWIDIMDKKVLRKYRGFGEK